MVDAEKLAPYIKKVMKTDVDKGFLVQGDGAFGSFKVSASGEVKYAAKQAMMQKEPKPKKAVGEKKKPAEILQTKD